MALSEQIQRANMIKAKLLALKKYEHKDRPEWSSLLQLLILDTREVRLELQQLAWEALSEAAKIPIAFPALIFTHATRVVTSGDGKERAFAAKVLCSIAEHKHSWPVSQRSGHAVAAVDDALLSLAVASQRIALIPFLLHSSTIRVRLLALCKAYCQVRHDVVLLLPRLRTASEKYVNIVLDKRKTLLLQRKEPSATVSKLPESPPIILEGAAGALSQLLEDEFDFVRCSAARAVAALSYRSSVLAETALELLMSALFDYEPIMRVAALAGMRIALNKLSNVNSKTHKHTNVHTQENPAQGQQRKKGIGMQIPAELYQSLRNCLEDSSMEVRLATVRLLNGMKFPTASKLLPVLHRLITIASPLHWVPLPIAGCHHPQQQHTSDTDASTHESIKGESLSSCNEEEKSYAACAMCVIQVLRTLATLAACNAEHTREAVALIINSKCGFSVPNMVHLKDLMERAGALPQESRTTDAKASPGGFTASCVPEKTEQDSTGTVDGVTKGDVVAATKFPSAPSGGMLDGQKGAAPDSPHNMQELGMKDLTEASVDVLKAAIDQGSWKLVPKDEAPGSAQQGNEQASQTGLRYSQAEGSDGTVASTTAAKRPGGLVPCVTVAQPQPMAATSAPPHCHGSQGPATSSAGTRLPYSSMAPPQLSRPIATHSGATVIAVSAPQINLGAQSYAPAHAFAPAPHITPLSTASTVVSQHPHPPTHPPGVGPAHKRPALMHGPHVVQQAQLPARSMHVLHPTSSSWVPQVSAPRVLHPGQPMLAPGIGLQPQHPMRHGNTIVIPHNAVHAGGGLQLAAPHVVPHQLQLTGAAPHALHSMPSSMQLRPPVNTAGLYSVTPVRPKGRETGASETSQSSNPNPELGNTRGGYPHQRLDEQEERKQIARLLPTPPVPRDPGSEILRSVATLVLIGNAAHALHGKAEGASDTLLKAGSSENITERAIHAQCQGDEGVLGSAAWSEHFNTMIGSEQPHKQTDCELKDLFQQWKHVCQALASSGSIGEWKLKEVLPAVI